MEIITKEKEEKIKNRTSLVLGSIFLVIVLTYAYYYNKDLDENGLTTEGTIIGCDMIRLSGSCMVDVEFFTLNGERRVSRNTLYDKGNCMLGKKVKVRYSTTSNRADVFEDGR